MARRSPRKRRGAIGIPSFRGRQHIRTPRLSLPVFSRRFPSPYYAQITCCERGYGRPCGRVGYGREVYSAKAHSRAIDSGERGQAFGRKCGGKPGRHSCHPRKVEAPDAFCAADHPAAGAAPASTAGGTTISTILRPHLVHNAGWGNSTCLLTRFFDSGTQGNEGQDRRLHQ